jgi:hypothetical protein
VARTKKVWFWPVTPIQLAQQPVAMDPASGIWLAPLYATA